MEPCEIYPVCRVCGGRADYCEAVPDDSASEGLRWAAVCWLHHTPKSWIDEQAMPEGWRCRGDILRCDDGVARLHRDYCGGVVCEGCGKEYSRHPRLPRMPWMIVLCDGSACKL